MVNGGKNLLAGKRLMSGPHDVRYVVLPDSADPYLLARIRWPDVAQAVTAGCHEWLEDPGLFDLPTDPSSATVTFEQAAEIAAAWGVSLMSEDTFASRGPSLIRRMPANWSNLSPGEIRAWSLDFVDTSRRLDASREIPQVSARRESSPSRRGRWWWRLRGGTRPRPPELDVDLERTLELLKSMNGMQSNGPKGPS